MVRRILVKKDQLRIKKLDSIFKLVRIEHAFMYAIAVLIGAILVNGTSALTKNVIYAAVVAVFIEFGAFALNDYIDYKADKLNRRIDRPLVNGEISRNAALVIGITSFLIANIIALSTLPPAAFLMIILFTFLSLAYDFVLKNLPFLGNFVIALTMAIPFFFGAYVYSFESNLPSNSFQPVLCLSVIAFFVGLGREIMKDIEDIRGDSIVGGKTLPLIIGKKNSALVAGLFFIASIIISLVPFFTFFSLNLFYLVVLITDFMLIDISLHIIKDQSTYNLRKARKMSLIAIGVGLLAFLLASLYQQSLI